MSGLQIWLPVLSTVFTWWFSTGLILLLVRLPKAWYPLLLLGYGGIACVAGLGLFSSATQQTPATTYCAFLCALLIWGWHEASFLMGIITGPRPFACPENVSGWRRFGYATATLIYHEIALFLTLLIIAALSWQSPNQTGLWVFSLLFAMRLSAKFNIFLGVPNLTEEFFPTHLEHLKSYLPKRSMNWLMPISLIASMILIFSLGRDLIDVRQTQGDVTALAILTTLAVLGMLEHIFMITPLPDAALWRWAVPVRASQSIATSSSEHEPRPVLKKPENA